MKSHGWPFKTSRQALKSPLQQWTYRHSTIPFHHPTSRIPTRPVSRDAIHHDHLKTTVSEIGDVPSRRLELRLEHGNQQKPNQTHSTSEKMERCFRAWKNPPTTIWTISPLPSRRFPPKSRPKVESLIQRCRQSQMMNDQFWFLVLMVQKSKTTTVSMDKSCK